MGRKELSTLATRAKSAGNNKHDVKKERKKEDENCMGRKELSTLATRAKTAGNNKHDTKKERKKEHEIAGQKNY